MNVLVRLPGFYLAVADIGIGMAEITPLFWNFSGNIKPNPVIVAENILVVFDSRRP
jgi:hypothetical protein